MAGSEYESTAITSSATWYAWTATSATTCTSDVAWGAWTTGDSTAVTIDETWRQWTSIGTVVTPYRQHQAPPIMTPEQVAEAKRALKDADREWRERQRKSKEAYDRAEKLFMRTMNEAQREQYQKLKAIEVRSSIGTNYRIKATGVHGNIEELNAEGQVVATLCVAPKMEDGNHPPNPDCWAAQKLWLEHDLEGLLKVANRRRVA
jgi:hypothetical protein